MTFLGHVAPCVGVSVKAALHSGQGWMRQKHHIGQIFLYWAGVQGLD